MAESDLRLAPTPLSEPLPPAIKEADSVPAPSTSDRKSVVEIVRWMLVILAAVYALSFALAIVALSLGGMTFENTLEFVKFMIGSLIPLAALVVGYYLGERSRA